MAEFIFFEVDGLPKDTFKVVSFTGREAISTPFAFDLDVLTAQDDVDFWKVLGKAGHLRVAGTGGDRYVHGIVRRIEETSRALNGTRFDIALVPDIWRLSQRQTSRIFQNQSVPDVVQKVLNDAKIPSDEVKVTLHGQHVPWEYCVQYRESDLAFASRLLEHEGIFYFLEHDEKKATLRLGDTSDDHPAAPQVPTLAVRPSAGMAGDKETILRLVVAEEVRPDASEVRDYNFTKPDVNLKSTAKEGPGLGSEVYDAPGEYDLPEEGREVAKLRLQELRATRRLCSGDTTCNRLVPGHTFEVGKHARNDLNGTHLILEVTQHGAQPQVLGDEASGKSSSYSCSFRSMPFDVPYRPPRVTPRPLAQGAQTAVVVGPAGEEVHTDEYGRIKVQFHWDREGKRDDSSSCWIRVAQAWAGSGWGAMFVPRINQEVIVEFLDGDPDQPIVTGCVYNANNMPPYPLGADKTKSTIKSNSSNGGGGSNEIRFEDKKGSEQVFIHAQKNQDIEVGSDETHSVGNDRTKSIGHDETVHVNHDRTETVANNETITIGVNRSEHVGAEEMITIGGSRSITVSNSETASVALQRTHTVGVNETISVGGAQAITVGGAQATKVGGAQAITVGASQAVNVGGVQTVSIGAAKALTIGGGYAVTVGGAMNTAVGLLSMEEVGLIKKVHVGRSLIVDAGDSVTIKTGSASITMHKDGTIAITGKDVTIVGSGKINVEASSTTVVKGSPVDINP